MREGKASHAFGLVHITGLSMTLVNYDIMSGNTECADGTVKHFIAVLPCKSVPHASDYV